MVAADSQLTAETIHLGGQEVAPQASFPFWAAGSSLDSHHQSLAEAMGFGPRTTLAATWAGSFAEGLARSDAVSPSLDG